MRILEFGCGGGLCYGHLNFTQFLVALSARCVPGRAQSRYDLTNNYAC